jgi:hypothetical protein
VVFTSATDVNGNTNSQFSAPSSSFTFWVDKDSPTITALSKPNAAEYTPLNASQDGVLGTLSDPLVGGTSSDIMVNGVDVQLWYLSGNTSFYWNGSNAWNSSVSTLTAIVAAHSTNWNLAAGQVPAAFGAASYNDPAGTGAPFTNHTFYVWARAHDNAKLEDGTVSQSTGNASPWRGSAANVPFSFVVAGALPITTMTWPVDGMFVNRITSFTGTYNTNSATIRSNPPGLEIAITTNPAAGEWWKGSVAAGLGPWWDGANYVSGAPIWSTATISGGSQSGTWAFPGARADNLSNAFADGKTYYVYERVIDNAPNISTGVFSFTYSLNQPAIGFSSPAANAGYWMNDVPTFYGSATDALPVGGLPGGGTNIQEVSLFIKNSAGQYYNPGSGNFQVSATPIPIATTLTPTGANTAKWQYTSNALNQVLTSGFYVVFASATDVNGNTNSLFSAPASSFTFWVDKDSPTITALTQPALTVYTPANVNSVGVSGTVSDPLQGSTSSDLMVNGVDVQMWYLSGNTSFYWNGAGAWNSAVSTLTAVLAAHSQSWSLPGGQVPAASGNGSFNDPAGTGAPFSDHIFYVWARAHDNAVLEDGTVSRSTGNASFWRGSSDNVAFSFAVDGTNPVSTVTWPTQGMYASAVTSFTGTFNAATSGIRTAPPGIEISLTTNPATGPWWDGKAYTQWTQFWATATVSGSQSGSWAFPGAGRADDLTGAFTDANPYYLFVRETDLAGNAIVANAISFIYDTTKPGLTLRGPNFGYYSNRAEAIAVTGGLALSSGTVSDGNSGVGTVYVAVSSGGAENWWWNDATRTFVDRSGTTGILIQWSTMVYQGASPWSYAPAEWAAGSFVDGIAYKFYVKAGDQAFPANVKNNLVNAGDAPDGPTPQALVFDMTRPTAHDDRQRPRQRRERGRELQHLPVPRDRSRAGHRPGPLGRAPHRDRRAGHQRRRANPQQMVGLGGLAGLHHLGPAGRAGLRVGHHRHDLGGRPRPHRHLDAGPAGPLGLQPHLPRGRSGPGLGEQPDAERGRDGGGGLLPLR